MEFNVGDRVRIISRRRPSDFGSIYGYEGIISKIWDTTLNTYMKGRNIEIEFFDDELRNYSNSKDGILWESRELEFIRSYE